MSRGVSSGEERLQADMAEILGRCGGNNLGICGCIGDRASVESTSLIRFTRDEKLLITKSPERLRYLSETEKIQ
jgi:hypothetical protein